ncbi:hypothetical protein [Vibrio splendidus]|uniref:hypothetical protein n=1 Tax=Vibrio splendidus TaxID=29497 RepID=UPI0034A0BE69
MIISLLVRAGGALASLVSTSMIISVLGLNLSGDYFTSVAYALIVATCLSFGVNGVVVKYAKVLPQCRVGIIKFIIINLGISFIPTLVLFFIIQMYVKIHTSILFMAISFSVAQAFHLLLLARNKVNISYCSFNILPHLVVICGMLIDSNYMFNYYIVSYLLSICLMMVFSSSEDDISNNSYRYELACFRERANFFQQEILGQAFTSITMVLISLNLNSSSVAIFNIYQKLSSVSNIILSVMNQSKLSKGLDMISSNKWYGLISLSNDIFVKSSIFLSIYTVAIVLMWDFILINVFNINSISVYPFVFLSLSYYLVAKANIATYMLNACGCDEYIRNVSYVTFIVGLLLLLILPSLFGIIGGVLSVGVMLVSQSFLVRMKFVKVFNVK